MFIDAAAWTFLEFQGSLCEHRCVYGASKVTGAIPVTGYFRSLELKQSFAPKHYVFEHSCNTALVVAALSYDIPDSEVRCLLPVRCPAATFSSSERFAAICTQHIEMKPSSLTDSDSNFRQVLARTIER